MTRPQDLAARIRAARESLEMDQSEVAAHLGVHRNTVGGWESGKHVPRNQIPALERFFGIDLSSPPDSDTPRLTEASDAQILADLARRLAERDRVIRDLRRRLGETDPADTNPGPSGDNVLHSERWAARPRRPAPE